MNFVRRSWVGDLAIAFATFVCYLPALDGGFVWDDDLHVRENPTLRSVDGLRRIWAEPGATPQYYPLTFTSFWLDYQLWGLDTRGYHAVNIALHVVGALLLRRVLWRLGVPGAWLAAALFALHPVHAESVAWITERKNVLSGVFYFASMLWFIRFSDSPPGRPSRFAYGAALVFFAAALAGKTVTCTLPAALALIQWYRLGKIPKRTWLALVPMFVLAIGAGLVTAWVERAHVGAAGDEWSLPWAGRLIVAGRLLWFYAGQLVWPARIVFIYPRWSISAQDPWPYLFPASAMAVIVFLWLARDRLGRGPLAAVLFFAGTLGPALGFFNVFFMRYSFAADHFQYLASAGILALAAAALTTLSRRWSPGSPAVAAAVSLVLLAALGVRTATQAATYRNLETLWRDVLAKNPAAWLAHNNLAVLLMSEGRYDEARPHVEKALRLKPDYAEAHLNLGRLDEQAGAMDLAEASYRRSIQCRGTFAEAHEFLARLLMKQQRLDEAMNVLQGAIEQSPGYEALHGLLGVTHGMRGDLEAAGAALGRALDLKPDSAELLCNFGYVELERGDVNRALEFFRRALLAERDYVPALENVQRVFERQRGHAPPSLADSDPTARVTARLFEAEWHLGQDRKLAAVESYRAALREQPDWGLARWRLGRVLLSEGDVRSAISELEVAAHSAPRLAEARADLGDAYRRVGRVADAIGMLESAVRLKPDHVPALRTLAWILATTPEDRSRHGSRALVFAERANTISGGAQPLVLDALAAAYAECGRYSEAVATAERAIARATALGRGRLADAIEGRRGLYSAGRPFRDASPE